MTVLQDIAILNLLAFIRYWLVKNNIHIKHVTNLSPLDSFENTQYGDELKDAIFATHYSFILPQQWQHGPTCSSTSGESHAPLGHHARPQMAP